MPKPTVKRASSTRISITGRVTRIHFASAGFTAGRFQITGGEQVGFKSSTPGMDVDDYLTMFGAYAPNGKYGDQFVVSNWSRCDQLDTEGLTHYLATHKDFKNIGPQRAAKIVAAIGGDDFEDVLRTQPERLLRIAGITRDTINGLLTAWEERREHNATATALAVFELTPRQIETLIERYGGDAPNVLRTDPFKLIEDLSGYGFKKVDAIARKLKPPIPCELPSRIRAGIIYVLNEMLSQGSTCMSRESLVSEANKLLIIDRLDAKRRIEDEIGSLIAEGKLIPIPDTDAIALHAIYEQERYIMMILTQFAYSRTELIPPVENESLNPLQRQAVTNALTQRISLISGPAGSGKTYCITNIIEAVRQDGLDFELAAPTGKAARRMTESSGESARTIHRLLEHNGTRFQRDEMNPLTCDVLVIDEFSMVDVPLCAALFHALDMKHTRVILVGDHNQLPPVGPGNLLRDMLTHSLVPSTVLTQVHRQAGLLKINSEKILQGVVAPHAKGSSAWYVFHRATPDEIIETIKDLFLNVFRQKLGVADLLSQVQVLTPMHRPPIGTESLNTELQRLLQRELHSVTVQPIGAAKRLPFLIGDKVIQMKNNYDLNVMNGTTGIITSEFNSNPIVEFNGDGIAVEYEGENKLQLAHAYASTVHKMQGSETDVVVVVISKTHSIMHNRNLLYTACTRAKRVCVIIGEAWTIRMCAQRTSVDKRMTLISASAKPILTEMAKPNEPTM